jgi:hypothetical protein
MVEFAVPNLYQVRVIPFIFNHLGNKMPRGKLYHFSARIVPVLLKPKDFESTEGGHGTRPFPNLLEGLLRLKLGNGRRHHCVVNPLMPVNSLEIRGFLQCHLVFKEEKER